jgi:hypothetical protein
MPETYREPLNVFQLVSLILLRPRQYTVMPNCAATKFPPFWPPALTPRLGAVARGPGELLRTDVGRIVQLECVGLAGRNEPVIRREP